MSKKIQRITGKTGVIGIFGFPVEHSFSPVMHNAAFQAGGLDYVYVPFEVPPERLAEAVSAIRALKLRGVNVTIPHKERVVQYLDSLSEEARLIGAVNTIVRSGDELKGYNTDAAGFLRSLEEKKVAVQGANVLLLGAGGAARAVAVQLALAGARRVGIVVRNSGWRKAEGIAEIVAGHSCAKSTVALFENTQDLIAEKGNIIINCTPVGMHPNVMEMPPFKLDTIPADSVVCDLIYNPAETLFLKTAKARGLKTVSGSGMLLYQGTLAYELWTRQQAPVDIMRTALEEALQRC
ncbi:shikimate dehydrogenase [Thermincola ferriacetica]